MFTELVKYDKRTDFELIGKTDEGKLVFKFEMCGHRAEYASKQKTMRCMSCYEEMVKNKAAQYGLSLVNAEGIDNHRFRCFKFDNCGHTRIMQVHEVISRKRSRMECHECNDIRLRKEEATAGVEYIRASTEDDVGSKFANYKLYRFIVCGHEQHCQPTHVRRNNIKCYSCFEDSMRQDAARIDSEIIKHLGNAKYLVRFSCGHETETYLQNIRKKLTDRCTLCYEERIHREAEQAGVTIVGETDSVYGAYRKYKINSCGHTIDTNPACIREGRYECKECKTLAFEALIAEKGLKVISKTDRHSYRLFELPCGCTKEIRMEHARNDVWLCGNCGDTYYTKPSNLYLFKFSSTTFSWLKFGFAKDLDLRSNNYGVSSDFQREVLISIPMSSGYTALEKEKKIHALMKCKRLDKELMMNYHKHNGYTECYPLSAESELLQLIKENT